MTAPVVAQPLVDPAWVANRQTYLGASDAPTILGLNPYQSAFELWLVKTGQKPETPETAITRWGHRVEQVAADIYQEETGRRLRRYGREVKGVFVPSVQRHRQWPEIACNPDRGVIGERRGVQIKSSWSTWSEIPERFVVQVQHEMGVMGWEVVDLALLTGFAGFATYEVRRNDALIDHLFEIERAWWQRHVVEGKEPERTGRYLNALRGEDVMRASDVQVDWLRERRAIDEAIERLKARRTGVDERIKRSMAGARQLDGSDHGVKATWVRPWSKEVEETDWHAVALAFRAALLSGAEPPPDTTGPEWAAAIEALHTQRVTRTGGGGLTVRWKDVEPTSEED